MNNNSNNIVLIGFMGSGKTTVGKWISQNVGMTFCDTDEYIEKNEQCEIKDIFAEKGEEYFRNLETATIESLCSKLTDCVVSVGGGLPVREVNRELLKKLGTVVYLRASEETLVLRLEGDSKRPLLAGSDVKPKIHELMLARENIYMDTADIIVDTDNKTFEQIYNDIENSITGNQ